MVDPIKVEKKREYVYEIAKEGEMQAPGRIYANDHIIKNLQADVEAGKAWNALTQIKNVAMLPGIQQASLAMPDVHPGYGFAIGGVGAFDTEKGVISVAGVGFDINCGVRTLRLPVFRDDIKKVQKELTNAIYEKVPAGLGSKGDIRMDPAMLDEVAVKGSKFVVDKGYGFKRDLEFTEANGIIEGANPDNVSETAKKRQLRQVGTLGSGNHYIDVQYVEEIYDEKAMKAYGLEKDQAVISFHCGSRAYGHQVGTDYLKELEAASKKYKIPIRERELVCAPFSSPEGQRYFSAVNCGMNLAFANRQAITHLIRQAVCPVLSLDEKEVEVLYDIGHNTAKLEKHEVDGKKKELCVMRKGATRAFGPGRDEVPSAYRKVGQPVLIGGTMGTYSYILHGTDQGMKETFGSACHGAGRVMSRHEALRKFKGADVVKRMADQGITVKGHSIKGVAEEAPEVYKDVNEVVGIMHESNISKKVVRVRPMIVVMG